MNEWWSALHGLDGLSDLSGAGEDRLSLWLGEGQIELGGAVGDSVTLTDHNGTTVYADLDGDGVVDHISSVHHDGGYEIFTADPHRAAWGLVGVPPEDPAPDGNSGWGLPPNGTPEMGESDQGLNQGSSGWHRIERG